MTYIDGFVVAVPAANKAAYLKLAEEMAPLFREFGATRVVETWGDDVPDGKLTDFRRAVKATADEVVVFSWLEYPSSAVRKAANEKMATDTRMREHPGQPPFDGQRMIFGGFELLDESTRSSKMGYIDGMLCAVPNANREAYRASAAKMTAAMLKYGATRVVDAWGDDVPRGKVTDYQGAVQAQDGETVVFSWIEWPSKEARDAGWPQVMADESMQGDMPFDMSRMIYGGFAPILDA